MHYSKNKVKSELLLIYAIRPYVKHNFLISPFPKRVKKVIVEHPYTEVELHFDVAITPKAIKYCGKFKELWTLSLN